jgi:hypothetical protein
MTPEIERLIGGYATGTLTPREQEQLLQAALEDQAVFDSLMREQPLRELVQDPVARQRLLKAVAPRPAGGWARWWAMLSSPRGLVGAAAVATLAFAALIVNQVRQPSAAENNAAVEVARRQPPPQASPAESKPAGTLPASPPPVTATPQALNPIAPVESPAKPLAGRLPPDMLRKGAAAQELKEEALSKAKDAAAAPPPPGDRISQALSTGVPMPAPRPAQPPPAALAAGSLAEAAPAGAAKKKAEEKAADAAPPPGSNIVARNSIGPSAFDMYNQGLVNRFSAPSNEPEAPAFRSPIGASQAQRPREQQAVRRAARPDEQASVRDSRQGPSAGGGFGAPQAPGGSQSAAAAVGRLEQRQQQQPQQRQQKSQSLDKEAGRAAAPPQQSLPTTQSEIGAKPAPTAVVAPGLRYTLFRNGRAVAPNASFEKGDEVRIKVQSNSDGAIYVYLRDGNMWRQQWRSESAIRGQDYEIPAVGSLHPGDRLLVVASRGVLARVRPLMADAEVTALFPPAQNVLKESRLGAAYNVALGPSPVPALAVRIDVTPAAAAGRK